MSVGNGLTKDNLSNMTASMNEAANSNSNGFGYFNEKGMFKTEKPFTTSLYEHFINANVGKQYVVTHFRFATSCATSKQNSHPFVIKNNYLVHNGIIQGAPPNMHDSVYLLSRIVEAKGKDYPDKIHNAIMDISGSFSCFLKDEYGNLFYFKDGMTGFCFCYLPELKLIVGASDKAYIDAMFCSQKFGFEIPCGNRHYFSPENNTLFRITNTKGIEFLADLVQPKPTYLSNYGPIYGAYKYGGGHYDY